MSSPPSVAVTFDAASPELRREVEELASRIGLPPFRAQSATSFRYLLTITQRGIELRDGSSPQKAGVRADFTAIDLRTGTGNLSRKQPLGRAIGRNTRRVLDATAGLGHDAALLALMGCDVTAVERSPVLGCLIEDGLRRAMRSREFAAAIGDRLRIHVADAREVLSKADERFDAVYLDPMYPPKRKRSALAKKSIRVVRELVGDDPDAVDLFAAAQSHFDRRSLTSGGGRIVVKRPSYAEPLIAHPNAVITGTLVRYDLYFVKSSESAAAPASES